MTDRQKDRHWRAANTPLTEQLQLPRWFTVHYAVSCTGRVLVTMTTPAAADGRDYVNEIVPLSHTRPDPHISAV